MQSQSNSLNLHDWKVIAFHVIIAMVQGGLVAFGAINFGIYTPMVTLTIQVLSEAIRRYIAG